MASTISASVLFQTPSLPRMHTTAPVSCKVHTSKPAPPLHTSRRNLLLFSLTAMPVLTVRESASLAEDIPLFGLRKNLKQAEKEAVEIVKEAEKKIERAEKEIETAEKEIETAEKEIETSGSFGGLAQAGAVAGAEVVGVLVATSVVSGILGPDTR
ncbi:Synechocystis YCF37 [Melia azedarach]|uniref:Synechocystis YCF37 n=1 Tax=Melia azedarach TaxID=155640 RepID=A0ACC1XU64_MELAZ|nr:Synechocystis YCF37 [Melia azedarach]